MWDSINGIIGKAQTELFLFLILIAVVIIVLVKPIMNATALRKKQDLEREKNILGVIQNNTTVIVELKTLLKETNDNCKDCKAEQLSAFKRVEDKHDANALVLNDIQHNVQEVLHGRSTVTVP